MLSFVRNLVGIVALAVAAAAVAQPYPAKPIRLIVPYPPGGGTDFFARTVGAKMSENLGQQLIIENRPGAATIIGAEAAARSAPDGYTVLLGDTATYAVNPTLYRKLPYDPVKDFAPISLTGRFALLLVVNPAALDAGSMKALLELAKKSPGRIDYASPGPGSPHHLAMEMFKQRTGTNLAHVPYKGAGPAVQDLLGGRVPVMFLDVATAAPQIKGGKLKALAVASDKRIAAMPDVPTIAELGVPGFEAWAWQGLAAPAKTPAEVVAKLNAAFTKAINDPAVKQKIVEAGIDPLQGSPQQFADYVKSETAKWAKVIKDGNITVE
jgi:tripartite-type tricarboxylate transporter receptor subunit TctC